MSAAPFYDDGTVMVWCADVREVPASELAESAACAVTSPPYNVGLVYDGDDQGDALAWDAYWRLADAAAVVMARALLPGGRAWVNTAVSVPETPGAGLGRAAKRRVLLARGWADALELGGRRAGPGRPGVMAVRPCRWLRVGVLAVPGGTQPARRPRADHRGLQGRVGTPRSGGHGGVA